MNETTLRNKKIKQALLKKYSPKDTKVIGGRGTAYGWVEVKVTLDKPSNCTCQFETKTATWAKEPYDYTYRVEVQRPYTNGYNDRSYYCDACLAKLKANQEIVDKTVYGSGAEFSHYCSDDGYNTERAECLTQVDIRC